MFSRKKIAVVSGFVGGIAVTCFGLTPAYAGGDPGTCIDDLLGNLTCTQRIKGEVSEGGAIPHQETCKPVQPVRLPAVQLGGTVTCSPETVGVPPVRGGQQEPFDDGSRPTGQMFPVGAS